MAYVLCMSASPNCRGSVECWHEANEKAVTTQSTCNERSWLNLEKAVIRPVLPSLSAHQNICQARPAQCTNSPPRTGVGLIYRRPALEQTGSVICIPPRLSRHMVLHGAVLDADCPSLMRTLSPAYLLFALARPRDASASRRACKRTWSNSRASCLFRCCERSL